MITVGNLRRPAPGIRGVNVGRPSALGNPASHRVGTLATVRTGTVAEAIAYYRAWLPGRLAVVSAQREEFLFLLRLAERWDLQLLCWCHPGPCHAQVLKEFLDNEHEGRSHVLDRLCDDPGVRRPA